MTREKAREIVTALVDLIVDAQKLGNECAEAIDPKTSPSVKAASGRVDASGKKLEDLLASE